MDVLDDLKRVAAEYRGTYCPPGLIDAAIAEIKWLRDSVNRRDENAKSLVLALEAARAENEALWIDAERYRWLRIKDPADPCFMCGQVSDNIKIGWELDDLIDAARA